MIAGRARVALLLALFVIAGRFGISARDIHQQVDEPTWAATLRVWRTAVEDHQPGTADDPVIGIHAWSERDLNTAITDLLALRDRLAAARAGLVSYGNHSFTVSEIAGLLGLPPAEASRGDINRLLKRAAVLHTDIATLRPTEAIPFQTSGAQMLRTQDGRSRGFQGTLHWDVARRLLDAVTPSPASDDFVRSWYRATAALLLFTRNLAYADPHLDHARRIFPKDAAVLFATGCLHETYASPLVQAAVRSADSRLNLSVGGAAPHWREAERFFREALASDPALADARLRLGRVVGLLGRHEEAIAELRAAVDGSDEMRLRYYGEMFVGAEERALGHDAAARGHYERAAQLCPTAASPYFALSDIGRRQGDRAAALAAMQHAFTLAADRDRLDDPWWTYNVEPFRNAEQLIDQWRRGLPPGSQQ